MEAPDARYTELLGNKPEPCHSDLKTPNPHASSSQSQLNLLAAAGLEAQTGQDQQCAPCALQILWEVKKQTPIFLAQANPPELSGFSGQFSNPGTGLNGSVVLL